MKSADIAAYVDGALSEPERAGLERHLADCARCRDEVVGAWRAVQGTRVGLRAGPRAWRRRAVGALVAVAAGVVLLVVSVPEATRSPTHRADAVAPGAAPVAHAPRGSADASPVFAWSAVPEADLYRVIVFDGRGRVLLERETGDTTLALPAGALSATPPYFWKVEARTDWDRWRSSELVEFIPRPQAR